MLQLLEWLWDLMAYFCGMEITKDKSSEKDLCKCFLVDQPVDSDVLDHRPVHVRILLTRSCNVLDIDLMLIL